MDGAYRMHFIDRCPFGFAGLPDAAALFRLSTFGPQVR